MNTEAKELNKVCNNLLQSSNNSLNMSIFLANYMSINAQQDLARFSEWTTYANEYETKRANSLNKIQNDHLFCVLLDIPIFKIENKKLSIMRVVKYNLFTYYCLI